MCVWANEWPEGHGPQGSPSVVSRWRTWPAPELMVLLGGGQNGEGSLFGSRPTWWIIQGRVNTMGSTRCLASKVEFVVVTLTTRGWFAVRCILYRPRNEAERQPVSSAKPWACMSYCFRGATGFACDGWSESLFIRQDGWKASGNTNTYLNLKINSSPFFCYKGNTYRPVQPCRVFPLTPTVANWTSKPLESHKNIEN